MDNAEPLREPDAGAAGPQGSPSLVAGAGGGGGAAAIARPSSSPWVFQYRVLKALVLRNLVATHGETRLGFLMGIIIPVFSLAVLMAAFGLRGKIIPSNFSMGAFLLTGYPLWQGFVGMYRKAVTSASRTDPLLMFPQITQLDLILASVIQTFATDTVVYLVMMFGVIVLLRSHAPGDFMGVVICYWACLWLGAAFGMIVCAGQRVFPMLLSFINPFMRFGMWFSGVVFMVNRLPSWTWPYLRWNPILHCVEGARQLWEPSYKSTFFDPGYVIICIFVLTTAGFVLERISRRLVGP